MPCVRHRFWPTTCARCYSTQRCACIGGWAGNGGFIDPRAAQSGMVRTGGMISNSPASNMVKNAPLMTGWMEKEGCVFHSWKRRFFKLTNTSMTYYDTDRRKVKGTFQVKWITHVSDNSGSGPASSATP